MNAPQGSPVSPPTAFAHDTQFCPVCGWQQPTPPRAEGELPITHMQRLAIARTTTCHNTNCNATFWACYFRLVGSAGAP